MSLVSFAFKGVPSLGFEGDFFAVAANQVDAMLGFGDMTNEIYVLDRDEFLVVV
jgi:hypothetical protein